MVTRSHALLLAAIIGAAATALAHPLGNFSLNHFVRVESGAGQARLHYVVDLAEIPTFQETQIADTDSNGVLSATELNAYLERVAPGYVAGLRLTAEGAPVKLQLQDKKISLQPGAAELSTLRMVFTLTGEFAATTAAPRLRLENTNQTERAGWRELVITAAAGTRVFNSTIYGDSLTNELQAYPEDLLMAPLSESAGEWSVTTGAPPANAKPLLLRNGQPASSAPERFAARVLTPRALGLLLAVALFLVWLISRRSKPAKYTLHPQDAAAQPNRSPVDH
jgi:hypothetical protein